MHCILIGVTGPCNPEKDVVVEVWKTVTVIQSISQNMGEIDPPTQPSVNWIACSTAHDDDNVVKGERQPVTLLCATTEVSVDDVIDSTARVLSREFGDEYTCELWASAPAILPLRPIEGYDQYIRLSSSTTHHLREDWTVSTMKEWGIFVQAALISTIEAVQLKHSIDEEITRIENLIHHHSPDIVIGKDVISFQEIASRGKERFDLLLSPNSTVTKFVKHVLIDRVTPILERILNGRIHETINYDISVVYSKPNATNQGWHADGDHQKGTNDAGWDAAHGWKNSLAEPYAICLFLPLIDLDDHTGFTQFWPASHRYRGLAGFGPVAEITEATYDGKCGAGDAIWYDYRLMHRGMKNISKVIRPVLQVLFKKTWYVEKRNYGTILLRSECD